MCWQVLTMLMSEVFFVLIRFGHFSTFLIITKYDIETDKGTHLLHLSHQVWWKSTDHRMRDGREYRKMSYLVTSRKKQWSRIHDQYWLCYVGVYVTVFSILCSLSSFFVLSYLFGCYHFLMNKDVYSTSYRTLSLLSSIQCYYPVAISYQYYKAFTFSHST